MKKHLWAVLAMMLALVICMPAAMGEEEYLRIYNVEDLNNEVGSYISESGTYVAEGKSESGIVVDGNADVTLILNGVDIGSPYEPALNCSQAKSVKLVLADETENRLASVGMEDGKEYGRGYAGIWNAGVPLTICCQSVSNEEDGHICDDSCGVLDAVGSSYNDDGMWFAGAGIGGCVEWSAPCSVQTGEKASSADGRRITIFGGNINARGGMGAAGIGGGFNSDSYWELVNGDWTTRYIHYAGSGLDITIAGGNVQALGGDGAAGIGGAMDLGLYDMNSNDDLEDYRGGSGERISVIGGDVQAFGGMLAPGIGGGYLGKGEDILITGGEVYAQAGVWDMPEPASEDDEYNGNGMPEYMPVGSGAKLPGDDVTPDSSNIRIAPKSGTRIRAGAGNSLGRAAEDNELKGSPFTSGKDITDQLKGKTWFATMTEEAPNTVQPSTGDGMGAGFWAALLMLSAAAFAVMKRRTA